jgi:tetratricopeptide (TPR) repeat protein
MTWFSTEQGVLEATVATTAGQKGFRPWQLANTMLPFYQRLGAYHAWAALARVALDAAVEAGDLLGEAHMLRVLAGAENRLADNVASAGHLLRAQELFEKLGLRVEQGYALGNLGFVRYSQDRHRDAVGHYQDALALFLTTGHHKGEAVALQGMSYSLVRLGEYDEAIHRLQTAVGMYTTLGDDHAVAACFCLMADIQHETGRRDESIGTRLDAIRLFTAADDRVELVAALYDLTETYAAAGRRLDAQRSLRQALRIAERAGLAGEAERVRELGERLRG